MNKFLFVIFFYDFNNKRNMDPFLREFMGNKTLFYGFLSLIKVPFAAAHPYQLPIQVTPTPVLVSGMSSIYFIFRAKRSIT